MHFFIHTKHLKGESSNSTRKTAKVKQNRPLVMSLHLSFITYAVSTAILLLCTVYSTFFLFLYVCFPFLPSESRFCRFSFEFCLASFQKRLLSTIAGSLQSWINNTNNFSSSQLSLFVFLCVYNCLFIHFAFFSSNSLQNPKIAMCK